VLTTICQNRLIEVVGKRRRKSKKVKANRRRELQRPSITINELHIHQPSPRGKGWIPSIAQISLTVSLFTLLLGNNLVSRLTSVPSPTSAVVSYVRTDTTTKGNWRRSYGAEGYAVPGEVRMPPTIKVAITSPANNSTFRRDTVHLDSTATSLNGAKITSVSYTANGVEIGKAYKPSPCSTGECWTFDWSA
jgi:hypothetical protein